VLALEDGTVTLLDVTLWKTIAALLLLVGSALIIRALMLADLEDAPATVAPRQVPAAHDLRKAA
jgi:hypothetical protein